MLLLFSNDLSGTQLVTAIFLAAVCALLGAAVGRATSQLPTSQHIYLGAATFVLAGIFEGYLAYARESTAGQVRGAAVIRDNKKAVVGLFVAEGSGRVYIARVTGGEGDQIDVTRSRLVGIAKDEVTDVAVGERKPVHDALNQASALAKELCELQPKPPPPANGTIENCRTAPPGDEQP